MPVKPAPNICKFTYPPDPGNRASSLHHNAGSETTGFVRGSNLDVGQLVLMFSNNGKRAWVGWLTSKFHDDFGDGWNFTVRCAKYNEDRDPTPEQVSVIVIDPSDTPAPSDPMTAVPSPADVP
jgi:hypothetical protein